MQFRIIFYPKIPIRVIMKNSACYHIQLKSHRTTVSLDKIISDLMAVKLEKTPGTKEAHRAVRQQLEQFISTDIGLNYRNEANAT